MDFFKIIWPGQSVFITASHSFPFVKKRIEVTDKKEIILSPIEVAIDEMTAKVVEIREVVDLVMPDMKKLQLKLQGSVSAQVSCIDIQWNIDNSKSKGPVNLFN